MGDITIMAVNRAGVRRKLIESIQYVVYVDVLLALITGKRCLLQKLHDQM